MSRHPWRKALWHLRNGGVEGFKDFRRRTKSEVDSAQRATSGAGEGENTDAATLSVVIPAFNVGDHIEACLCSILNQKGVSLEVLIVDDGSTDDTVEKARAYTDGDSRVSILEGVNEGPARARNRGVNAASGRYITFADADDEVLADAYSTMIDSLERTGSDVATGSYIRIGKSGRTRPKLTARVHSRQRLAVRLDDMPELLEEPVLWNKVYRSDFWKRHVGEMWEFANYEDQEPVYRALVGASAVDVLTDDVYAWRLADGRSTRSRRKAKLTDLQAKLEVIDALRSTLDNAPKHVLEHAYSIWMGTDLAMHAEFLDTANKRFRKTLCAAANDMKKTMPRGAWKLIPAQERLFMWIVAAGRLDDIEEILGTRAEETRSVPLEYVEGRWVVVPTYLERLETKVPKRLVRARDVDFAPQMKIRNTRWVDEQVIELQGCAYIPGIDPSKVDVRIHGVMDGAVVVDEAVEHVNDNRVDLEVGDPWRSYSQGGFRARIDLSGLDDLSPRGIALVGRFGINDAQFHVPARSTAVVGMIVPSPVLDNCRVTLIADEHDELSIQSVRMPARPVLAKQVSCRGRDVTITLDGFLDIKNLTLRGAGMTTTLAAQGRSIFTGTLPELPERYSAGGERLWSVLARTTEDQTVPVHHVSVDYMIPDTSCVRLSPNLAGAVHLSQRFRRVSITGAANDRDRLLLTGRIDPPANLEVVLRSSEQTIVAEEYSRHTDGNFTAVYDLTTTGAEGGKIASMSGGYHVRFGKTAETAEGWARAADKLATRPVDCFTEWNTLRVEARPSESVAITASPPWSAKERTKVGRFALRTHDWGPLQPGIVFESYNGKSTNDNPRALFDVIRAERADIPLYWSIRDRRVDVPEGGIPVVEGTADWHRALATSHVWINNNNFPYYVRKRRGQFYLQTWHGTPNKRLLLDIPRHLVPLSYRRLMMTEVAQWDLLLATNERSASCLRRSLGYQGKIQLIEYPRNIRIFDSGPHAREIKRRMGLEEAKPTILYAPTWRARKSSNNKKEELTLEQDIETLAQQVDANILVRSHHMVSLALTGISGIVQVSTEPHVEELIAVSDLLVTDYSSISHDYALTGKPIVIYAPDEHLYRRERGLYQKWTPSSSVRVTRSLSELVSEVQRISVDCNQGYESVSTQTVSRIRQQVARISEAIIRVASGVAKECDHSELMNPYRG
ncbi:CDP-glycerol glycerophosphotransferase family protein [Brevibacterium sp. S111]|uniref:bifunctional glycosyltransferase/CDP-glycerol:glycerophosphate glycerophosphotransferase n=1 Tax=Brevibacterium sp. S111 TaxID=2483795 RepID=UPI0010814591|nr:CDP-glycerol glycerophosphotransferase family protein [Brevibacterium sp. S111]TGD08488.1 glycosyltransferase [Brevibacterium sp. S111]